MNDIKCEILETLIEFPEEGSFHKELNIIKWGDNSPKYDLRGWTSGREKMTKGVTLTKEELTILKHYLGGMDL